MPGEDSGLITAVTVRLLPLPEAEATVTRSFAAPAEAAGALRAAGRHRSHPATLEIVGGPQGLRVMARILGDAGQLQTRADELRAVLGGGEVLLGDESAETWRAYERERALLDETHAWRLKLSVTAPGLEEAFLAGGRGVRGSELGTWPVRPATGSTRSTGLTRAVLFPVLGAVLGRLGARGFVAAEGAAAAQAFGAPGWSGFPPHRAQAQDRVDAALVAAIAPAGCSTLSCWTVPRRVRIGKVGRRSERRPEGRDSQLRWGVCLAGLGPGRAAPGGRSGGFDPLAVQAELDRCNKCGFCMAGCPTYKAQPLEWLVTRGRVSLIQDVLAGPAGRGRSRLP